MESTTSLLLEGISTPKTFSKYTSAMVNSEADIKVVPLTQRMAANEDGAIKQRKTA